MSNKAQCQDMGEDSLKLGRGQGARKEWRRGMVKKYTECKSLGRVWANIRVASQ